MSYLIEMFLFSVGTGHTWQSWVDQQKDQPCDSEWGLWFNSITWPGDWVEPCGQSLSQSCWCNEPSIKSLNTEAWISFLGGQYSMYIVTHQSGTVNTNRFLGEDNGSFSFGTCCVSSSGWF